ncbi:MAG: AI-2E family transporter [bacterium]|nr:AI-2E family transporter [bacterium]MDI1337048.1 AI-2E family transporter [Lacunisphaera sp.]
MTPASEPVADPTRAAVRVVRFELSPSTMLTVGLVALSLWLLVRLMPVLLVLVAALMLVGMLNPLVAGLERRRFRRGLAIGLVFGISIGLTALGLFLTLPTLIAQLHSLIDHEPEIRNRLVGYLDGSTLTRPLADWLSNMQYGEVLRNSPARLLTVSLRAIEIVAYGVAAVFLALYIMIDRDRLRGALFAVVPRRHHIRFSRVLLNLETIVGGYIRGQVITCVLIAVFMLAVLLVCHVPNALALAVFGGVMDVLPYIGALLTIVPAVLAAYVVGPGPAALVFVLLLLYEEFESRVLVPVVYGRALRLPSSVVFFSLLAGGVLAGVVGALLALPIAAAVLMLLEELRVDLPGETEQAADRAVRREDEREEREYEKRTVAASTEDASAIAVEISRERKESEDAAEAKDRQTENTK